MWGCVITVVNARSLTEERIMHDLSLEKTHIALVFNQSPMFGHYTPASKSLQRKRRCVTMLVFLATMLIFSFYDAVRAVRTNRYLLCKPMMRSSRYQTPPPSPSSSAPPSPLEQMAARSTITPGTPRSAEEMSGDMDEMAQELAKAKARINLIDRFMDKYKVLSGKKVRGRLPKNQLACEICTREFPSNNLLQRHHMKVHEGTGSYVCPQCDKSFLGRAALKAHEESIHQDKGLPCLVEGCEGKSFGTKRALKSHEKRFHQGGPELNLKCAHCEKIFKVERDHKAHEDSCRFNPERPEYKCKDCERVFGQKKHLNKHIRDEHM